MKRRFWIGGVLLLMIFTGMTGCGGPKEPPPEHMLDGPDMMYTPEDQTPYAGTWQSRDGTIVMKVERGGGAESESDMSLSVNGEPEFEAKLWVYSTGHVDTDPADYVAQHAVYQHFSLGAEITEISVSVSYRYNGDRHFLFGGICSAVAYLRTCGNCFKLRNDRFYRHHTFHIKRHFKRIVRVMTVQYNTGTDYISAEIAVIDYSAAVLRMDKKPLVFCYLHQLFLLSVGILHI